MNTLDELEKLADVAMSPAPYERETAQLGLRNKGVAQTIKQLITLVRIQHNALERVGRDRYQVIEEALAAYEKFERGR